LARGAASFVTQKMNYSIREMTIGDYDEVYRLWEQTEGLNLEEGDSREAIDIYLRRNQGLCFIAYADGHIVGTVLCGHEGRRGILRHLAVNREHRGKGIARALINQCLSALAKDGIKKCNTFVLDENVEGRLFWERMGWYVLEDNYRTMQTPTVQDK
jgi:ribosomal protein S18 acetylase RimI-like enzyme